ncbi:MAG TPA: hypothetical protein VN324_03275, partial [Quisquiliibacterium sp.]|nr:hypothetical protein [Quisquiliibacterium sp.]
MPPESAVRSSPVPDPAPGVEAEQRAPAGSRPAIEFKGLSHPALRAVLNDASPDALRHSLIELLDGDPDRFEWQPVVIDLSRLEPEASPDWPEVLAALRAVRLHPVAVAGAPEEFREEANRLQLGWLAPIREPRRRAGAAPGEAAAAGEASRAEPASPPADEARGTGPARAAPDAQASADAPAAAPAAAPATLVIDRPVRSGQR